MVFRGRKPLSGRFLGQRSSNWKYNMIIRGFMVNKTAISALHGLSAPNGLSHSESIHCSSPDWSLSIMRPCIPTEWIKMLVSSSLPCVRSSTCDSTENVNVLSTHGSGNILFRWPIYMKRAQQLDCGHFMSEFFQILKRLSLSRTKTRSALPVSILWSERSGRYIQGLVVTKKRKLLRGCCNVGSSIRTVQHFCT